MFHRFLALAALLAVALVPVGAQTRQSAPEPYDYEGVVTGWMRILTVVPAGMRDKLHPIVVSEMKQVLAPILARPNCFMNSTNARAVDLNGDDTAEVLFRALRYCREGGPTGHINSLEFNWIFIQQGTAWRISRMVPDGIGSVERMENGFLLIAGGEQSGGPAVNPIVQRYDGQKYEPWCTIQKWKKPISGAECADSIGRTVRGLPDFGARADRVRHLRQIGVPTTLCMKTEAELKASRSKELLYAAEAWPDCRQEVVPVACAMLLAIKTVLTGPDFETGVEAATALRGIRTGKFEAITRDPGVAIDHEREQCASAVSK